MKHYISLLSVFCLYLQVVYAQNNPLDETRWSFSGIIESGRNFVNRDEGFLDRGGEISDGFYISLGANCNYRVNSHLSLFAGGIISYKNSSIDDITEYFFRSFTPPELVATSVTDLHFKTYEVNVPIFLEFSFMKNFSIDGGIQFSKIVINDSYRSEIDLPNFGGPIVVIPDNVEKEKIDIDLENDGIQLAFLGGLGYTIDLDENKFITIGARYYHYINDYILAYQASYTNQIGLFVSLNI